MSKPEMWVQKTVGKTAKCRICGERIKDDFRLVCWASRQGWAFFHILCVQELGDMMKQLDLELIFKTRQPSHGQIKIDDI